MGKEEEGIKGTKALKEQIEKLQKNHSFFPLLVALQQHLVTLLPKNYKGENKEGYLNKDEFLPALRTFLPANIISDEALWVKEDEKAINLDWLGIKKALYKIIIAERYLHLTRDQEELLLSITSPEIITRESIEKQSEAFQLFFSSTNKLNAFLTYHDELPNPNKIKLMQFFAATVGNETFNNACNELTALQNDAGLKDEFYQTVEGKKMLEFLKKQLSPNPFLDKIKCTEAQMQNYIQVLKMLPRQEQIQLLKEKGKNNRAALINVMYQSTDEVAISLLDLISQLDQVASFLQDEDVDKGNAALVAIWKKDKLQGKIYKMIQGLKTDELASILKKQDNTGFSILLYLVANNKLDDTFLNIITSLPLVDQAEIFKTIFFGDQKNAFMKAIEKVSVMADSLFTAISKLNITDQQMIYVQPNSSNNVLFLAQKNNSPLVTKLLETVLTFEQPDKKYILMLKHPSNETVVDVLSNEQKILALKSIITWDLADQKEVTQSLGAFIYAMQKLSSDGLGSLFAAIQGMNDDDKAKIIKNMSVEPINPLVHLATHVPTMVKPFLDLINNLPQPLQNEAKNKLFMVRNGLLYQVRTNQQIIPDILAAIQTLTNEEQISFYNLNQASPASYLHQESCIQLYQNIAKLTNDSQIRIFDSTKENVLTSILRSYSDRVLYLDSLIATIKTLSKDERYKILLHKNNDGNNAISLSSQPKSLSSILELLEDFTLDEKKEILLASNLGSIQLYCMLPILKLIAEFKKEDQKTLLNQLNFPANQSHHIFPLMHTLLKFQDNDLIDKLSPLFDLCGHRLLDERNEEGASVFMVLLETFPELGLKLFERLINDPNFNPNSLLPILSEKSKDGSNALMIAAKHSPSAVTLILDCCQKRDEEFRKQTYLQKNDKGFNALMIALYAQPESAKLVWDAINTLQDKEAIKTMLHNELAEYNPLRIALVKKSDLLLELVKSMIDYNDDKINKVILSQLANLIGLVPKYPELFTLLNSVSNPEFKKALYTQQDKLGNNFLMHALALSPELGLKALEVIASFDEPTQAQIYEHTNHKSGLNALFFANLQRTSTQEKQTSELYQEVVRKILTRVFEFKDTDLKNRLLIQKNPNGVSALMLARDNLIPLDILLKELNTVSVDERKAIFQADDGESQNLLSGAAYAQPEFVPDILKAITVLNDTTCSKEILLQGKKTGQTPLYYALSDYLDRRKIGEDPYVAVSSILISLAQLDDEEANKEIIAKKQFVMLLAQHELRLLALILELSNEKVQRELLTSKNKKGETIAWKIALSKPEFLTDILERLLRFNDPNLNQELLKEKDYFIKQCLEDAKFLEFFLGLDIDFVRETLCHQQAGTKDNLVMGLLKGKSQELTLVLDVIFQLNDEDKILIFTQTNAQHCSILGVAIKHSPKQVTEILKFISPFSEETQKSIIGSLDQSDVAFLLKEKDKNDEVSKFLEKMGTQRITGSLKSVNAKQENALMVALQNDKQAATALITKVSTLEEADRELILQQRNHQGLNVLMLSIQFSPIFYSYLLNLIKKPDIQKQLLLQITNPGKENILAIAIRHNPQGAAAILKDLNLLLDPKQVVDIIKQTNSQGMNTLMLAVGSAPDLVPELVTLVTEAEDKKALLMQINSQMEHALIIALKHNPTAIDILLDDIKNFDEPTRKKILQQQDKDGNNVLVIAAEHAPEKLEALFNLINQVQQPADVLWKLLEPHKQRILSASKKSPEIIPVLLKNLSILPVADRLQFYNATQNNTESNLLSTIGLCEIRMADLLEELAEKEHEFKGKVVAEKLTPIASRELIYTASSYQKAHYAVSSIRQKLQESFDEYMKSNKDQTEAHKLKITWEATLSQKAFKPIIEEQRASVGKILAKLIMACTVIGLAYFLYQQIQKNKKGQGFFETNTAHLMHQLKNKANELDSDWNIENEPKP